MKNWYYLQNGSVTSSSRYLNRFKWYLVVIEHLTWKILKFQHLKANENKLNWLLLILLSMRSVFSFKYQPLVPSTVTHAVFLRIISQEEVAFNYFYSVWKTIKKDATISWKVP